MDKGPVLTTAIKELRTKAEIDRAIQTTKDKVLVLAFLDPADLTCMQHLDVVLIPVW